MPGRLTLADFDSKLLARVEGNALFYDRDDRVTAINEALQFINNFVGFSQGRAEAGVTYPGRTLYQVPQGILFASDVYLDSVQLFKSTAQSASNQDRSWISGGEDQSPVYWVPIGLTKFAIVSADPTGGKLIEVEGVTVPAELVSDTDVCGLQDEWVDVVIDYAYMTLVLDEGGKIFADASKLYSYIQTKMRALSGTQLIKWPRFWPDTGAEK